jgi:hypothetical protein
MSMGFFCLFGASAIVGGVLTPKDPIVACLYHGKVQVIFFKKRRNREKSIMQR